MELGANASVRDITGKTALVLAEGWGKHRRDRPAATRTRHSAGVEKAGAAAGAG